MASPPPHQPNLHWHLHWQPALALIATGIAYAFISSELRVGPPWLLPTVIVGFLVSLSMARRHGRELLTRRLGLALSSVAALAVGSSVAILVVNLFRGTGLPATNLLRNAALLWLSNVAVYGIWYWELDGDGP